VFVPLGGGTIAVMRIVLILPLVLALTACAARRGEILGPSPLGYQDTAFVEVGDDEYFWIAPPPNGRHGVPPAQMQVPKAGVWVLEGWFTVESQCFTPKDRPLGTDPIIPETDDQQSLYIHAGHRYLLTCSPTRVGKFVLEDQGVVPAG